MNAPTSDPFVFECNELASSIRVLAFTGEQRLSEPFCFRVFMEGELETEDFEGALGKPGTLFINDYPVHGLVFETELRLATDNRRVHCITLRPDLHRLSYTKHSRVYVEKSVIDIIDTTLQRAEVTDYELRLSGSYPLRRQITQYQESDLTFLHRWMEREGIYYYHLQTDTVSKLVITDDIEAHDSAPGESVRYYLGGRGDWHEGEGLDSWRRLHQAGTANVELGDSDFLKPALAISGRSSHPAVGFETMVRFGDNLLDPEEARRLAKVRQEMLAANGVRWHGAGNVRGLHEGLCFGLEEHPREAFNQRYQVLRVTHHGSILRGDPTLEDQLGLPSASVVYQVQVDALQADTQYRPPRKSPWPHVPGLETAWVDGKAESNYAQLDSEGRYRVRFRFDEQDSPDGNASAWVRMQQPHGGVAEGFHLPLRKKTEVLIAFVHGDPDRPYISGTVPTPHEPSPVTEANATQNVVQTGARNRLEIEDLDGQQYIDVSSPNQESYLHLGAHAGLGDHNIVLSTAGDGLHHSGNRRDVSVVGNQTEDVIGNLTEEYSASVTTHVQGAFDETINSGMTQTVASGSVQVIEGGLTQTIDGGETRTVNGDLVESIRGGRIQTIHGDSTETIHGGLMQTISGGATIATPADFNLTGSSAVNLNTPAAGTVAGLGGVNIVAPGGHASVDSSFYGIGSDKVMDYFCKIGMAEAKMHITGMWFRFISLHGGAYGLKVDLKVGEMKKMAKQVEAGALGVNASGVKTDKAILHDHDAGGPGAESVANGISMGAAASQAAIGGACAMVYGGIGAAITAVIVGNEAQSASGDGSGDGSPGKGSDGSGDGGMGDGEDGTPPIGESDQKPVSPELNDWGVPFGQSSQGPLPWHISDPPPVDNAHDSPVAKEDQMCEQPPHLDDPGPLACGVDDPSAEDENPVCEAPPNDGTGGEGGPVRE